MDFWGQKTFCLITGASRGIGRCIAIEFAKKVGPASVYLLIARDQSMLEQVKTEILSDPSCQSKSIQVFVEPLDLTNTDADTYKNLITSALSKSSSTSSDFEHVILIHNAGTTGNVELRLLQQEDGKFVQDYFAFNVVSVIILTSQFFKIFNESSKQRSIVQITSRAALQPFKCLGLYCAGKAARDMLMHTVVQEEAGSISAISYSPGPVDTDMYRNTAAKSGDPELREEFANIIKEGKVLSCIETVTKLIKVLGEKKYTKGEHVSYYDNE